MVRWCDELAWVRRHIHQGAVICSTCSGAVLLAEAGLLDGAEAASDGSDYGLINPNGYVPALVLTDGTLLTENAAIIDWIASQSPALLPEGALGRTRHLQILAFISTELQKPFIPLFFLEDQEERARLHEALAQRFRWIASRFEGDFLFGRRFTGADDFLYVMLRWAAMVEMKAPHDFDTFVERVERRESVQAVLAAEGFEPLRSTGQLLVSG